MSNNIFNQISGIIKINLKGKKPERLINMALARGIYIWDIKKINDNMQFKIRNNGWEALRSIADETGHEIKIVSEKGLPFFKNTFKRRMGFFTGALIFVLALYLMSSFVWFIEVSGNKNIAPQHIMITAAKYGVYPGAAKWSFSRSKVEAAMLRDISNISYVKVDIRGVKANIEVVEKVLPKDEITGPCHMIAVKEGIVEEVLILQGQANVAQGQAVTKGDILISGVVFPEENPYFIKPEGEVKTSPAPYLVRARGNVKAKVWYEGYGECRLNTEQIKLGENKHTVVFLSTPWKVFKLKGDNEINYPLTEEKTMQKTFDTPLGSFSLIKEIKQEQIKQVSKYSADEASEIARKKAITALEKQLAKSQKIVDKRYEVLSAPSDPIIRVKVWVETIENIAIAEPINVDE